jgi:CDP-diacylglycerol--serine O-phosphatidyltransferase
MNIKKHIPNTITCGNLVCGCLAIVSAFEGNLVASTYLVGIAAVLDFFDGFTARLLKVHSEIGKQLDSLADMVTFGVVPGVIVYHLFQSSLLMQGDNHMGLIAYSAFLIPVFSALRLAKFNIDTRQSDSFIGVPTPANAILICSLPLIKFFQPTVGGFNIVPIIESPVFLVSLSIVMSYLMVAELPLFALKFKNFGWADNKIRYSFLIVSLLLLFAFQFIAIPFIIFLYIIISAVNTMVNR